MDSEHRHELKENDLAEFLANFGQWWSKYGLTLTVVVLLAGAGITIKYMADTRSADALEQAWADLAGSTSPESYSIVAQMHSESAVWALGHLRGADLVLAGPTGGRRGNAQDSQASIELGAEEAAAMYQKVAEASGAHPVYKLNARLGLAALAEQQGDLESAGRHYEQVIEQAGGDYGVIASHAQQRLAMLDRLAQPVTFAPESPATQPAEEEGAAAPVPPPLPGVYDSGGSENTELP